MPSDDSDDPPTLDGGGAGKVAKSAPRVGEIAAQPTAQASEPSILDELMALSGIGHDPIAYALALRGLKVLIPALMASNNGQADVAFVDWLMVQLSDRLCGQIDAIIHHPTFQRLEAAWRSLKFLIDRVQFRENIMVMLLSVSKSDLLEDFQDTPEIPKSGLFKLVYSAEYGQFGGRPYGVIIADYSFSPRPQDILLLSKCAAVAAMAHAPFVAAASPTFFGSDDFLSLPQLDEVRALFSQPRYTKWSAFRETDDARFVGLCLPRFLLRLPYGSHTRSVAAFEYQERVAGEHDAHLWGSAAFAFGTVVARSFAEYRWCPHIVGANGGGMVESMLADHYRAMGRIEAKIPTEIMLTEGREHEIAAQGFICFSCLRASESACFYSAHSVQKVKVFAQTPEGRQADLNHRLSAQLPYLFMSCRMAHYVKVIQREQLGSWKGIEDLQRQLQTWVRKYVADQDVVSPAIRGRRPLRRAEVKVSEVAGQAGWYKVDLQIQPHLKFMGLEFQLDLSGRLDQI